MIELIFTSLDLTNRPLLEELPALQTYPGAGAFATRANF